MENDIERIPELGQVWTPPDCAFSMVKALMGYLIGEPPYRILDPAIGPATFIEAFSRYFSDQDIPIRFSAYDIDQRMCNYTQDYCRTHNIKMCVHNNDFILSDIDEMFDGIIMNPPYIRHEHISVETKNAYYTKIEHDIGEKIERRSNLYVLFLLKSILYLSSGGVLCAILYDAIMHSHYGINAMNLLDKYADLLSNDEVKAPFGDAIIDARIICWRKRETTKNISPKRKQISVQSDKNVPLGSLLKTVRGTALPYREIFLAKSDDPFFTKASPYFFKQRNPNLLTCEEVSYAYLDANLELQKWLKSRIQNLKSKNQNKEYKNEKTLCVKSITGSLCFNYYLRDNPRHILNQKGYAISDNYYVSTPNNNFPSKAAWILLNSDIYLTAIMTQARNQGHGLLKLQAYEYRSALVPNWMLLSQDKINILISAADHFLKENVTYEEFRATATKIAMEMFND